MVKAKKKQIEILQQENKMLRKKTFLVPVAEINSDKIKKIIKEMKEAVNSQADAVAIAAPQIGYSLQIFVVAAKVFLKNTEKKDIAFINPKIIKLSQKKHWVEEGCLSVRWLYGKVKRSTNVTISAYGENGEKITRGAGGLLAQIFQHETDHLSGVLFVDKAKDLVDIPPEINHE